MQDRGLAAYIAELVGTLLLIFAVCTVVVLYVATSANAQTGSDFAVVGLAPGVRPLRADHHSRGGERRALQSRRHSRGGDPAANRSSGRGVYILAQLSGGVLGALLVKGILLDEGRASHYGAVSVSPLLTDEYIGAIVEGIGAFLLVLAVCAVALNPRARREWAPLAIGLTLGLDVFIFGPLTGSAVNPARWFGPALIGNFFGGTWPYLVGPIVGAILAALLYRFVIAGGQYALGPEAPTGPGEVLDNVADDVETVARSRRR